MEGCDEMTCYSVWSGLEFNTSESVLLHGFAWSRMASGSVNHRVGIVELGADLSGRSSDRPELSYPATGVAAGQYARVDWTSI